ncbi:MAG TPA: serine hydrolase [Planctomycetaceae bacterium]|nr:serine hydrolase [Planctomycetaceae bacterium]
METFNRRSVACDREPTRIRNHRPGGIARSAVTLALLGCLLTTSIASAFPPAIPANVASNSINGKLDKEIDDHFAEKNLPGLVVLYARDGLLTYQRSLGFSDVANNVKMTEHRIGRLNSVSKWVGGIISLQQVEKGNLNLNASAKSYLSDLPDHHTYKVKDLLACRSGVRHYGETTAPGNPANWDDNHYNTALDAAPMIWNDPLASSVGWYHYSTHGYTILGAALEEAANKSIGNIILTDLNQKYGLPTLKAEDVTQSNSKRMKLYNTQNVEIERGDHSWKVLGGGIESSPLDLLKLGILLGDGKIISKQNVELMMKRIDPLESYALGCNHAVENGYHVMAKSGSFPGSNAYIWLVPERRMVMVVMANRDGADTSGLGKKLRNIVLAADKAVGNKPDLVVKEFKKTGNPQFKDGKWEIPFQFKVVNEGKAGANNSFVNGVLLGTKYRWSGFMDALPPNGASDTATGVVKIPDTGKLLAGRTIDLVAFADAPIAAADTSIPDYGRIDETDDVNNNKATLKVQLPGGIGQNLTGQTPNSPSSPGASNPTRVTPPTRTNPPRVGRLIRDQQTTTRVPTRVPGTASIPTTRPAVIAVADLKIRSIRFAPNQPQVAFVVVENGGNGPAGASVLQLTLRQIGNNAVSRTKNFNVPALAAGKTSVVTVDAASILPNTVALKSTTFRVDADQTKVVTESDETNNLEWHKP